MRPPRAIVYSAVFFGLAHMILQQSLVVCLVGVVIGYLAVQSGSLLPGMVFHLIHNALTVSVGRIPPTALERWPVLKTIMVPADGGYAYPWPMVAAAAFLGFVILLLFSRLTYSKSPEEELQEAIRKAGYEDQDEPLAASR